MGSNPITRSQEVSSSGETCRSALLQAIVAQSVEQLTRNEQVVGSSPTDGSSELTIDDCGLTIEG